jgi:hypothetical protein
MEHTAHIEVLSGIVRVFEPGKAYGDTYVWSATLRWTAPDTVEYLGALRAPTRHEIRAMAEKLREMGVFFVLIKRLRPDGSEHLAKLDLRRSKREQ